MKLSCLYIVFFFFFNYFFNNDRNYDRVYLLKSLILESSNLSRDRKKENVIFFEFVIKRLKTIINKFNFRFKFKFK